MRTIPIAIPQRSSVAWLAVLALVLIVFSYVFTLSVGIACAVAPFLLAPRLGGIAALVLLAVGLLMAGTILWSLVPKRAKQQIERVPLVMNAHPRLLALIEGIAKQLNEPVPGSIYLVADPNAFVTDRADLLGAGAGRLMALGLPLMASMTVAEFRAVLAHEFAHFYSGDTRLGPRVYQVRAAMSRTIQNLANTSGVMRVLTRFAIASLAYIVVVHGLIAYWKIFLRLTQRIARQQEYRADELAYYVAGANAMESGLQKLVKIAAVSQSFWGSVIVPALQLGYRPPLADGLNRYFNSPAIHKAAAEALENRIANEDTSAYDTHPPMKLRLLRVRALKATCVGPEDSQAAISLLENIDALEQELFRTLLPETKATLLPMDWDNAGSAVWVPAWRQAVEQYAAAFAEQNLGTLPDLCRDLSRISAQIPDPPGLLLTPDQRADRAVKLLSQSLALVLIENGWSLRAQPGECYLWRGEDRVVPLEMIKAMHEGRMGTGLWRDWCVKHEVSREIALVGRLA